MMYPKIYNVPKILRDVPETKKLKI